MSLASRFLHSGTGEGGAGADARDCRQSGSRRSRNEVVADDAPLHPVGNHRGGHTRWGPRCEIATGVCHRSSRVLAIPWAGNELNDVIRSRQAWRAIAN